jgi:hypothetical protein
MGTAQVRTHRMKNGAYVHYQYNSLGLLTDKSQPTWNPTLGPSDPKTHYDYYPDDPAHTYAWKDRVWKETDPRNKVIVYEYDRAFNSTTCEMSGSPVPGRGLITKISYPDDTHNGNPQYQSGTYRLFGYNKWGDKVCEEMSYANVRFTHMMIMVE